MVSFVNDIVADIKNPNYMVKASAVMRGAGAFLTAASAIRTVILITNPQFGIPLTVLQIAAALFETAYFYDQTKVGLNLHQLESEDITHNKLYQGTIFKKLYTSFKDDKLESTRNDDEKFIRFMGTTCRIMGTVFMASTAANALLIPFMPVTTSMKLISLASKVFTMCFAYDTRKLGENMKKLCDRVIEYKDFAQGTLIMKYFFRP